MSTTNEDGGEDVPHCWICHEEDTNELGEPLRRDCSCRGDSGFAHLSCLVEYAKHQTNHCDGRDFSILRTIWKECPCCNQPYQNELGVELATELVSYVEEQHPDNKGMLVTALNEKLMSLERMDKKNRCTPPIQQEAKYIANKTLSMFDLMKAEENPLLNKVKHIEPKVYNCLGRVALEDGTKEGAQEALAHFEKYRDLSILLRLKESVAAAEYNISVAKEECDVSSMNIEKKVEQLQKVYYMQHKKHGEGAIYTLTSGASLASNLLKADRLVEAESLLLKLGEVSKRVHGADHSVTEKIYSVQRRLRKRKRKAKKESKASHGSDHTTRA